MLQPPGVTLQAEIVVYGRPDNLIKTLFLSLLLGLASCALLQLPVNAAAIELVPSSRVILQVTSDMTIDDIIEGVYPQDKDLWPRIKQKLIETNSDSFVQGSDRLIPGMRLKLVDIKRTYEPPEPISRVRVGYVVGVNGKASVSNVHGRMQPLQVNAPVFEGDRLETGLGSSLHVMMDDAAELFIKEDSVLIVSEYVITSGYDKKSSSVFDLLRGGLRKITGAIGASPAANYQMHTGVANIGIRGTEYVIKLCKLDDCSTTLSRNDPEAKLHAMVLAGSITLTSENGVQVLIAPGEYATATATVMALETKKTVPVGFLDAQEAKKSRPVAQQQQAEEEKESSNSWMWIVGILLLVVGL
jgi:hypothetical protein